MIGPRVLPHDDDHLGFVQVGQGDGAFADTHRLAQAVAAGFVAHIRAVRQVVGTVFAYEQLVEESRLVTRPARGVKNGLVRAGQGVEFLSNELKRGLPGDRLVVATSFLQQHRLGQPPLLADLEIAPFQHLGNGMLGKKLAADRCFLSFLRDGFDAVLTVFSQFGALIFRVGPGAARAVDAALLIEARHDLQCIPGGHIFLNVAHCSEHAGYTCSPVFGFHDSNTGETLGGLSAACFFL